MIEEWLRRLRRLGQRAALPVALLAALPVLAAAQSTVIIHSIQTDLPDSPYLGDSVTTTGIVIAVLSDGFYIESPDSDWDSNTCTAEGIYVYTPSGVPSNAVSGYSVTVTGVVQASNDSKYAGTEIAVGSPVSSSVVTNSTGNSLPQAVDSSVLTAATDGTCSLYTAGSFGQWLPFEGMRVDVPSSSSLLVTQGTGGTVTPASQTATSNGQFWAVFTDTRPFRATGISELDTVPTTAPSTVSRWSGNPQLLLVDTTSLGGTAINATAGTAYSGSANLIGIIDYHLSTLGYTGLLLTSSSVSSLTAANTVTPTAAPAVSSGEVTVATQDLNDLTAPETKRMAKLASAIVNDEHSPTILAVQGTTPAALTLLQSAIEAAGGPTYSTGSTVSTADANGYVNAFLLNETVLDATTESVAQVLASTTYTSASGTAATLFGRSPLVLQVGIPRTGTTDYDIVVVNASLLERTNIDSTTLGAGVRSQREQQAQALATTVAGYESSGDHVFVAGGYDSFEFSDGYVDALGILDGSEPANTDDGSLVTLYDSTYNTAGLENTTVSAVDKATGTTNAADNRYTYVDDGSAEQPDHILISSELADLVTIGYARFGADFPVSETYDTSTAAAASTHDGVVAYLTVPYPSSLTLTSSLNPSYSGDSVTFTATVSSESGTPTGTVTFYDGSTELGTGTLSDGAATYTTSSLSVGLHTIKAVYGGDSSHDGSSGSLVQVVESLLTSATTLSCSPNPAAYGSTVTCTAAVTGGGSALTGTVTFDDGSTVLVTEALSSGTATFATSSLSVGSHSITAVYGGDGTYGDSTSNVVDEIITSTFSLTLTPASRSIYTGEATTYTVTVTPGTGFTLDVALTCAGAPAKSTCTVTPSTVAGGTGSATVSVQTTAPANTAALDTRRSGGGMAVAMAGVLLLLPLGSAGKRGRRAMWLLVLAVVSVGAGLGCGSPGTATGGTTPGTYTLTLTGTAVDGSLSIVKTATTTLTVKSLF